MLWAQSINSSLLNRQLVNLVEDEYEVKVAGSRREFAELLKVEFEWVGQDEDGLI
jgi:hypothetical protein